MSINADGSILFLSCDLQNSTQFKQRNVRAPSKSANQERQDAGWVPTFLAFYSEFPAVLGEIMADLSSDLVGRLTLWKAVGDELIFSCLIKSEGECSDAISVWIEAMDRFESRHLLAKTPMTLKGGAFLATVPFPDRRVAIPRVTSTTGSQLDPEKVNEDILKTNSEADGYLLDFVGPSIDTGFRVLKFAERRYFVLTVEVAHILFKYYNDTDKHNKVAYFLGTELLKGVWNGQPYPVFALHRNLGDPPSRVLADALGDTSRILDEHPSCSVTTVLEVVKAYRRSENWPGAVWIPEAQSAIDFRNQEFVGQERHRLDNLQDDSENPAELGMDDGAGESSIDGMPTS